MPWLFFCIQNIIYNFTTLLVYIICLLIVSFPIKNQGISTLINILFTVEKFYQWAVLIENQHITVLGKGFFSGFQTAHKFIEFSF